MYIQVCVNQCGPEKQSKYRFVFTVSIRSRQSRDRERAIGTGHMSLLDFVGEMLWDSWAKAKANSVPKSGGLVNYVGS